MKNILIHKHVQPFGVLLSVIIPTYREVGYLPRTLENLTSQTMWRTSECEAVVVDYDPEGSFEVMQIVRQFAFKGVRYVNVDAKGIGYARHEGAIAAAGEILMAFDADSYFESSDGMERLVGPVARNEAISTYCEILEDPTGQDAIRPLVFAFQKLRNSVVVDTLHHWSFATGITLRRKTYFDLGGFPDMYFLEDTTFIQRLIDRYGPESRVKIPVNVITSDRRSQGIWNAFFKGEKDFLEGHDQYAYR